MSRPARWGSGACRWRLGPALLALAALAAPVALAGCGGTGSADVPAANALVSEAADVAPPATPAISGTNGLETLPPAEAIARAEAALVGATSFRVTGHLPDGDRSVALEVQVIGGNGRATLGMDGQRITAVVLGGTVYVSGDRAFWTRAVGRSAAARMAGKFVRTVPTGKLADGPMGFLDRRRLAGKVLPTSGLTAGRVRTVSGKPVYELSDGAGLTFDIALTGEPYPLLVTGPGGHVEFTYGAPVAPHALEPPAASRVVDAARLP